MKIAVLGTGVVGQTIGSKLIQLGHEVKMGSRTADNEKAKTWVAANGSKASNATHPEAAAFGEIIFNCLNGRASIEGLKMAGAENLKGKILIDLANPLDFTKGFPPTLTICNDDSLGEQIQREFPNTQVVKTLNTMNCTIMANPSLVPGDHNVFMSGNIESAKAGVRNILNSFGWKNDNIIDLGDITTARGTEQMLPVWVRLYAQFKSPSFNFKVVRG